MYSLFPVVREFFFPPRWAANLARRRKRFATDGFIKKWRAVGRARDFLSEPRLKGGRTG
jgi:hypothetical protein